MQTSMETQVSQVLLGTEVTQEKPTPFQALSEHQDRKGSKEFQGSEAQSGAQDCRDFQASPLLPTSLGHLVTKEPQGYSAWKVTEAHRAPQGLLLFREAKEKKGTPEFWEAQEPKDGAGTPGPRAGLACSVSQEIKGLGVSKDSWET